MYKNLSMCVLVVCPNYIPKKNAWVPHGRGVVLECCGRINPGGARAFPENPLRP